MTSNRWIKLPTDEANDKPSAQSTTKIRTNATTQSMIHQPDNKSRRLVCDSTALWRAFFSRPRSLSVLWWFVLACHFLPKYRMLPTPKAPAVQTNATNHSIFPTFPFQARPLSTARLNPNSLLCLFSITNVTSYVLYMALYRFRLQIQSRAYAGR